MSTVEPPASDNDDKNVQSELEDSGDDNSVVAPPAYPAYSTPPPEGLHTAEDG